MTASKHTPRKAIGHLWPLFVALPLMTEFAGCAAEPAVTASSAEDIATVHGTDGASEEPYHNGSPVDPVRGVNSGILATPSRVGVVHAPSPVGLASADISRAGALLEEEATLGRLSQVPPFHWRSDGASAHVESALLALAGGNVDDHGAPSIDSGRARQVRSGMFMYERPAHGEAATIRNTVILFSDVLASPEVDTDLIESRARDAVHNMGLDSYAEPRVTVRQLTVRSVGTGTSREATSGAQIGVPEPVAYRAFVRFEIHGIELLGASAIVGFYLDGSLEKVHVRWPRVAEGTYGGGALDEMVMIERVASALAEHSLGKVQKLRARPVFVVERGRMRLAVEVSGNPTRDDGTPGRASTLIVPIDGQE